MIGYTIFTSEMSFMVKYIKSSKDITVHRFDLMGNQIATKAIYNRFKELSVDTGRVISMTATYDEASNETKVVFTMKSDSVALGEDQRYYALAAYEEYDEGNIAYIDEDGIGYSIADIVISDSQSKAMRYFREQYDVTFGPEYYIVVEVDKSIVDEWLEPGIKIYSV